MKKIFLGLVILMHITMYSQNKNESINYQSTNDLNLKTRSRVKDLDISIPKMRAEFFVRLYSLLNSQPEKSYEGYEFFIKDRKTGLEFSAGLTAFGVGYFAENNSAKMIQTIDKFNNFLFNNFKDLKDCKIEIENDFGRSIFGFENGKIIESF